MSSPQTVNWYRRMGGYATLLTTPISARVRNRIEHAPGERRLPGLVDTIASYGPGNWTYEWQAEAEALAERGERALTNGNRREARTLLLDAALLFATASYPHLTYDADAMRAMEKAQQTYARGAALGDGTFEVLTIPHAGQTFQGFLHLPEGDGPFPLLIDSAGSDVVKEQTTLFLAPEVLRRGIALLSIDLPGIGGSMAYRLGAASDELLVAALAAMQQDHRIDAARIAGMGTSFGGNAAARLFLRGPIGFGAVVSTSGPLRHVFQRPSADYDDLPKLTMEAVRDRLGVKVDAPVKELAEAMRKFALPDPVGAPFETPLLVLTTDRDPVAPETDLRLLLDRAKHAELIMQRQDGHCPPPDVRYPLAARWLEKMLVEREQA